ncbi:hypothetical protein BH23ACT2_BH23ACT2_24800 [soil metagenome]
MANYDSGDTPDGGTAVIQTALEAFKLVEIVINNAGILRDGAFKNMDAEKLEPVLDVHLKGAFYVTQAAWASMREQNYGRIVTTSSAAGLFGNFGQTNYGAAKAGLAWLAHETCPSPARSTRAAAATWPGCSPVPPRAGWPPLGRISWPPTVRPTGRQDMEVAS